MARVPVEMHLYAIRRACVWAAAHEISDHGMASVGGNVARDAGNDFGVAALGLHTTPSRRIMVARSGTVKYRIAGWSGTGFLVAGFWALFAIASFPSASERMRDVWTLISLTCPVAMAGTHYPISLYEALAANTATYALVGLIVELLRYRLHHAK